MAGPGGVWARGVFTEVRALGQGAASADSFSSPLRSPVLMEAE
jgi:hypothetical protein